MLSIRLIEHFVETHAFYAYIFVFLGVLIEGEVAVILAGIFAHLGSINPFIGLFCIILGGGLRSVLGYAVGDYLNRKHSHRPILLKIERKISYFLPRFTERPFWSIFVSRFFILGLHWFTIVYSGYKSINKKLYMKAELSSLIIWSVGVMSLGYFFSLAALSVSHDLRKFLGIILLCFIGFFLIEKAIALAIEIIGDIYDTEGNHKI
ncbi:MAG: hypothetical protein NTX85_01800 [Candidatus Nomurabacteria bacterium]|nr:hypothetical protein [Candidatus Nomurabacteria bacterium]